MVCNSQEVLFSLDVTLQSAFTYILLSSHLTQKATSALDAQSEHFVQSALQKIFKEHSGKTIISIAHRLSTIRHATTIAVLREGAIVQLGTFDELSTKDGPFRDLMKTQLVGDASAIP